MQGQLTGPGGFHLITIFFGDILSTTTVAPIVDKDLSIIMMIITIVVVIIIISL